VTGPFETEAEARQASSYRPGCDISAGNMADLLAAASGRELGAYDRRIIAWLAMWEPEAVAVVCGLIGRARRGGAS